MVMTMINRIWMQKLTKAVDHSDQTRPHTAVPRTRSKNRISRATLAAELGTADAIDLDSVLEHQDRPVADPLEGLRTQRGDRLAEFLRERSQEQRSD